MFQLLQPIWLLAIAGISVPLLIHLWNVKRGKTLKIGSVSLLRKSAKETAKSWKFTDLLLLILRCFIIILAALLLAKPIWWKDALPDKEKGWISLERQDRLQTYTVFKPRIDSLIRSGYELHYFEPEFPREDQPEEVLKSNVISPDRSALSYWTLLSELNQKVNSDQKVFLFTSDKLNRFRGKRPTISFRLEWHTYTPQDSTSEWIASADLISPEKIRITRARSNGNATIHQTEIIAAAGNGEFTTSFEDGRLLVFLKKNPTSPVVVDTLTTKVTVFADRFHTDANYLTSALEAIRDYTGLKMRISYVTKVNRIPRDEDWLFWLSHQQVPKGIQAKNRFIYQPGTATSMHSRVAAAAIKPLAEPAYLYKSIPASLGKEQEPLWKDGFGRPLLVKEQNGPLSVLYFYSRFEPAWNDLPWRPEFPELIHDLLFGEEYLPANAKDARKAAQIMPQVIVSKDELQNKPAKEESPLDNAFWIVVFILFLVERGISFFGERRIIDAD